MPTLSVKRDALFRELGQTFTDKEFETLCFKFGLELDEVTTEKELMMREQGDKVDAKAGSEDIIYKIDIPANRYDLLCLEGLSTALLVFQNKMAYPDYKCVPPSDPRNMQRLIIQPDTAKIRPYALAAVLRGVTFSQESYASFIDLQDKLHQNLARRRTLVAIGTHDLDTIKGPFVYDALPPQNIKFRPLNQQKEYTAVELMDLYSTHAQLKQYLPIIRDSPMYPVIKDANGVVLSMPPIINGDHSKITLATKNVFIEVTATDLTKAEIVLDTITTAFSQYCAKEYVSEQCEVVRPDGTKFKSPNYKFRKECISVKKLNSYIGFKHDALDLAKMLSRMCLTTTVNAGSDLLVKVPPTRHDVIHPVDIYEDAAIVHGYNNIEKTLPKASTVGQQFPINKLSDQLREEVSRCGYSEGLTFSLCSRDDIATKLRKKIENIPAVHIGNPKTLEFQVARTTLIPGLLKTVASNKSIPLPIKLFEVSDVVYCDDSSDTGAKNERRLCALYYNKTAGFEKIHGLLDRVMQVLEVPWDKNTGYHLKALEDDTFCPNRGAEIFWKGNSIGKLGVLHPDVITNFELTLPCSVLEVSIEPFL